MGPLKAMFTRQEPFFLDDETLQESTLKRLRIYAAENQVNRKHGKCQ